MFQRTIFRQAQAARSILSTSPSTASLALRRTTQQRMPALRPFAPQTSRFFSTEKETKEGENAEAEAEAENTDAKKLEAKEREVIELKDKYLRQVAESRNQIERNKRDMDAARKFAIQGFSKDLLDSIDNLDRALLAVPKDQLSAAKTEENKSLHELVEGLEMTQRIMLSTLEKHGLERFDPGQLVEGKAQKFDANLMEATFMAPSPNHENGDVMYVQSKGFRLNGRVLRAAKVGVAQNA
ncbi:hypothetical protein MYU51_012433 [Penicillium brevicompactum]|uniref:GrpE protein homolog n=1 Tax=Penicillium brevicompactum TaxID=5074 RepID=A0A9W9U7A8_PENBR|nr:uncharacterized protein N7506_011578 [Penicillium brevicompactum]KAJ5318874.1 hypothetical protein N7506_011578 [Penicillium brevicompactum]KAJ5322458.1 hypothetical protein N7452_010747 [Penicillium brevicompactum]